MAPAYMSDILRFSNNSNHNLRSSEHKDLVLQKTPRTNYLKDSFAYFSLKTWNDIPITIRTSLTLYSFKNTYKNYLLN